MSVELVNGIILRRQKIDSLLERVTIPPYSQVKGSEIQVVLSGLLFSEGALELATTNKFLIVYPSGARYDTSAEKMNRFISV